VSINIESTLHQGHFTCQNPDVKIDAVSFSHIGFLGGLGRKLYSPEGGLWQIIMLHIHINVLESSPQKIQPI
jgi:hypothetical protein